MCKRFSVGFMAFLAGALSVTAPSIIPSQVSTDAGR